MKIKLYYLFLSAALLVFSGCTDDFTDINTDKNSVKGENYIPAYSLTRAQLEFSGNHDYSYETWRVNIIYCSMFTQQLANAGWYAGDKYQLNQGWASAYFDVAYVDQVKYVVALLELTKDNPKFANLYQIGRIMKVLIFHRLTDLYGEVPYQEAGLGFYDKITTPKYDTQEDIYNDMLKELDEAAKALNPLADQPGTGDLIYGASTDAIAKWKKLAYSTMLRLGMRLTKIDETAAKLWVEKAAVGGVFTSNDDNAFIKHDDSGGRNTKNRNSNILSGEWHAVTNAGEALLSKTFVDFLKTKGDPRLQYLAQVQSSLSTKAADQVGLPNGLDQNGENSPTDVTKEPNYPGAIGNYSTVRADILLKTDGITLFMSYAQVELLLAEASKRGYAVGGTTEGHYNAGVKAAMKQLVQYSSAADINDTEIQNYLTNNPYDDATGYDLINTQYWAASFLDWYEVWANWRRSGFPALVPINYTGNATGGKIPRRMLYPASESASNATNYAEAIKRQGDNTFMTRVWWDKE